MEKVAVRACKFLSVLACVSVLLSFLVCIRLANFAQPENNVNGSVFPLIQDFYINNAYSGLATQFSFNCIDPVALGVGVLQTNITGLATNSTLRLSGTQAWANYTVTYPSGNSEISFDFWVTDSNNLWATTGNRTVNVYDYTSATTVSYFNSLSQTITAVQAANNFGQVSPYVAYALSQNQTSMQTMIDNYAATQQWLKVLEWAAICNKLWYNHIPEDVRTDINYALGNATMVDYLPWTGDAYSGANDFCVEYEWALYGYYYAAQSWALVYNPSITAKWNITAAYSQFDTSVNCSVNTPPNPFPSGLPLWIQADGIGMSYSHRYYDESADTIECYLLFAGLLNMSDAVNRAVYWWNYLVRTHWTPSPGYFGYTSQGIYECEAAFFLKIISMLKYYYPSLDNWTYVLEDIDNRFLSEEWNSPQWVDASTSLTTYAVVHADPGNTQRRLENTLGAWQALQGVYSELGSAYQSNTADMLSGNQNLQPAWALLLSQYNPVAQKYGAGLYDAATGMFSEGQPAGSGYGTFADDANATAQAEILLFMLGIVPGTTTVAFPLEQLNYEYIQDINPEMFQFNLANQTITIPVNNAGTMTFQYGVSPISCSFNQSGIWQVTFSNSWNMIANVAYVSDLRTNNIYFSQIDTPPYNVTINAHCITEGVDVNVSVVFDGSPTVYTTPCTFTNLIGTHTFTVSSMDPDGHPFKQWSTLEPTSAITVWSGGTYTAYYEVDVHDVAVTDVTSSRTVVGQGYGVDISVIGADVGDYTETFNVTLYANTTIIASQNVTLSGGTSTDSTFTWNTTGFDYGNYTISAYAWPVPGETNTSNNNFTGSWIIVSLVGDITGPNGWPDGQVNKLDVAFVARCFGSTPGSSKWNPNADVNGDGIVNMKDVALVARNFGQHYA